MLRSKASHNQALSGRNGVGMGLALESGTGTMETSKLRPVMDQHRKNYEACDRNGDRGGSATAHGALGSVVTAVGGRKAEGEGRSMGLGCIARGGGGSRSCTIFFWTWFEIFCLFSPPPPIAAFSNLEHQLQYSREVGDKFMEAR